MWWRSWLAGLILLCCSAIANPLGPVLELELREQVWLDRPSIRLADLAKVNAEGEAAHAVNKVLQQIELGQAPRIAYVDTISRAQIETVLRRRSGKLAYQLHWRGAASVAVHSQAQTLDNAKLEQVAKLALSQQIGSGFEQVEMVLASPLPPVEVPMGEVQMRARALSAPVLQARMPVWLDVLVAGTVYRSVVVPFNVQVQQKVFVAKHPISAGSVVGRDDVELKLESVLGLSAPALRELPANWRTAQSIRAGQVLSQAMMSQEGMVLRGDKVRVQVRLGAIQIETEGVAMSSARPGQKLEVRREKNHDVVVGRVSADGSVVISDQP